MKKVWTNGCYDILHVGHVKLFKYAKSLGDKLIVGIDSDSRVKELKGISRPINNQYDRQEVLLSNQYIDEVVIFNSADDLRNLIKTNDIHTIVVGEEYRNKEVIGSEYCQNTMFFKRFKGLSSTRILDEINKR